MHMSSYVLCISDWSSDLCASDPVARLHRFGYRVAFELAAAGHRDVGEDIGVRLMNLGHLVHRDRADAARADHQNLAHSKNLHWQPMPLVLYAAPYRTKP